MPDGGPSPSDGYTERNAAIERQFHSLPVAGTPDYWTKLEDAALASRLELETLVLCARDRLVAGARGEAERILGLLLDRVQRETRRQIESATPRGAHDRDRLIEDIMQECAMALWGEITRQDDTFLTRGFWHKLRYMVANTITQRLIAEGVRTRQGVQQGERIQQSQMASLEQPAGPEDDTSLGERVADPRAGEAFDLAATLADLNVIILELTSDQRLMLWNTLSEQMTQAQLAARFGITDRALRMRMVALRRGLRARFYGVDDPAPDAASEEG